MISPLRALGRRIWNALTAPDRAPAEPPAPPAGKKWSYCVGCDDRRAVPLDHPGEAHVCGQCPTPPMVFDYDDDRHWNAGEPEPRTFDLRFRGQAIQCRVCGRTSHQPEDVFARYCAWCHAYHDDLLAEQQQKGPVTP